jgi:transcriptional regulator with XRE-family HTH domain
MSHWTQSSTSDFAYSISMDFFAQLEDRIEKAGISRKELAAKLDETPSAVSQILNAPPENPKMETLVKYAREVGLKVAIVVYDDNDPGNDRGPIYSGVFEESWRRLNCPRDLFDAQEQVPRYQFNANQLAVYNWQQSYHPPTKLGDVSDLTIGTTLCGSQSRYWGDIVKLGLYVDAFRGPFRDVKKPPVSQERYLAFFRNQKMGEPA